MAQVTDEELEQKHKRIETLRADIEKAQSAAAENVAAAERDYLASQLDAEIARLETQLSIQKQAGKASDVKAGTASLVEASHDQQKAAEAQLAAQQAAAEAKDKE